MRALPTLRQLRYLVAVAETLHFGRAAEHCFVTQSTLSAGIRDLETVLGVVLIERESRRKVVITPLGEDIAARARSLLADAEALLDAAQAGAAPLSGELRFGVIPTIGPYVLPKVLPELRQSYPDLKLFLREEQTAMLLRDLDAGLLDVALLALPYDIGDLVSQPLWEEDVVVVMPRKHPLSRCKTIPESALSKVDLLMLEDGHCLREHSLQACGLRSPKKNEAFQATSLNTLVQMVASGLGVTLLPRMAVEQETAGNPALVVRNLEADVSARTVALVWRKASPRGADYRLLGELFATYAENRETEGEA